MSKISIIGCGWLGLPLGQSLVEKDYKVNGSTTSVEKIPLLKSVGIIPFLIKLNPELTGENIPDFFDTEVLIINIPPRRRREHVEQIHFEEIKNVIDAAVNAQVSKIIFCSSTGVYADNNQVATEDDTPQPGTSSTKALVRIENYLRARPTIQKTIVRLSGLVGGSRKAGRFLAGKKDVANGDALVNLVHRQDCIQVIEEIIQQGVWEETFNVCADVHPTRKDFYTQQALKQGFEPPTFKKDLPRYKIVSNQKVKAALNYSFLYSDPKQF